MVFPIALVLAGAQYGLSSYQQAENFREASRAQERYEKLVIKFTNEDLIQSYAALASRRAQESKTISDSLEAVTLDATRRAGALSVAAGEAGVRGNTVAALLRDFHATQLRSEQALIDTEQYANEQFSRDAAAMRSQAQQQIFQSQQARPQAPNYLQNFLSATATYLNLQGRMNAANTDPYGNRVSNSSVPNRPPEASSYSGPGGLDLPTS
jgi:hypothetical protein